MPHPREVLLLIAVFGAGAFWAYSAFATKQYVAGVRCLLASTIERIDNEAQSRQLKDEIIDTRVRLNLIREQGNLSAERILEAETLETLRIDLEERKRRADQIVKEASKMLTKGECEV